MSAVREQAFALAGVAQASRMIDQLSKTGSYPAEFLETSIQSLFVFDVDSTADVFGGPAGVRLGLQNLCVLLANQAEQEQRDVVRYFFSVLFLERQFAQNPELQSTVRDRLQHASYKAEHFASSVRDVCHNVAGIYQDTFSTLPRRIKVTGSAQHLENPDNADIVRSLLLAGVRSAHLWRLSGGRGWKIALQRRALLRSAQELSRGLGLV